MQNGANSRAWAKHLPQSGRREILAKTIAELTEDGVTSADRLEEVLGADARWYIIQAFKALDEADFGKYIRGRRGHPTRLHWNRPSPETSEEVQDRGATTEVYRLPLRMSPRFEVRLELPSDLSIEEVQRLKSFVGALPAAGRTVGDASPAR